MKNNTNNNNNKQFTFFGLFPPDILELILLSLSPKDLFAVILVCLKWRDAGLAFKQNFERKIKENLLGNYNSFQLISAEKSAKQHQAEKFTLVSWLAGIIGNLHITMAYRRPILIKKIDFSRHFIKVFFKSYMQACDTLGMRVDITQHEFKLAFSEWDKGHGYSLDLDSFISTLAAFTLNNTEEKDKEYIKTEFKDFFALLIKHNLLLNFTAEKTLVELAEKNPDPEIGPYITSTLKESQQTRAENTTNRCGFFATSSYAEQRKTLEIVRKSLVGKLADLLVRFSIHFSEFSDTRLLQESIGNFLCYLLACVNCGLIFNPLTDIDFLYQQAIAVATLEVKNLTSVGGTEKLSKKLESTHDLISERFEYEKELTPYINGLFAVLKYNLLQLTPSNPTSDLESKLVGITKKILIDIRNDIVDTNWPQSENFLKRMFNEYTVKIKDANGLIIKQKTVPSPVKKILDCIQEAELQAKGDSTSPAWDKALEMISAILKDNVNNNSSHVTKYREWLYKIDREYIQPESKSGMKPSKLGYK